MEVHGMYVPVHTVHVTMLPWYYIRMYQVLGTSMGGTGTGTATGALWYWY